VWPAALPIFLCKRELRKLTLPWLAIGVAATFLYFYGWVKPSQHPPLGLFFEHPVTSAKYLMYYFGSPVMDTQPNYVEGSILLALFLMASGYLIFVRRSQMGAVAVWISLGIWSLLTAFATAVGRVGLGLVLAASSRYTTISILFMIATVAVSALAMLAFQRDKAPSRWQVAVAGLGFLILSAQFLADFPKESAEMQAYGMERRQVKRCITKAKSAEETCLAGGFPDKQLEFQWTQYLKQKNWGGFSSKQESRLYTGQEP